MSYNLATLSVSDLVLTPEQEGENTFYRCNLRGVLHISEWEAYAYYAWTLDRLLFHYADDSDICDALRRIYSEGWRVVDVRQEAADRLTFSVAHGEVQWSRRVGVDYDQGARLVCRSSMLSDVPCSWVP